MKLQAVVKKNRKRILWIAGIFLLLFLCFSIFINRIIEPIFRERLHSFIISGSDSLYTYTLGDLHANFFGAKVEVENLQVTLDSNRYRYLKQQDALPAMTMTLILRKGTVRGIGLIPFLFGKKVQIREIRSDSADVVLSRHIKGGAHEKDKPLWKSFQPSINSISVDRLKLDGLKLLYRHGDTARSVKIQFDECNALFEDLLIDSTSATDSSRIGFSKNISFRIHDLKYRTDDSSYKMKAEWIHYSFRDRLLQVDSFKLQPTLDRNDFYRITGLQKSLYYVEFRKVKIPGLRMDQLINNGVLSADSAVFERPLIEIYQDKTVPHHDFESKIGQYPHQLLQKAPILIRLNRVSFSNADISFTEKNGSTGKEGTLHVKKATLLAENVTNDSVMIRQNNRARASLNGALMGSQASLDFIFFLGDSIGRFEVSGWVKDIGHMQLNPLTMALGQVRLNSLQVNQLAFKIKGEDMNATGSVRMRYNNLSLTFLDINPQTGEMEVKKFITKLLNKLALFESNPGSDGLERTAENRKVLRLTTQSFFGLIWRTVLMGMQDIMLKPGTG